MTLTTHTTRSVERVPKPYFTDGEVTIYHGDCREILPLLSYDAIVSDPPYGMAYQSGWKPSSRIQNDETTEHRDHVLSLIGETPALVFGRWSVPRPASTRELLIWDKGDWPGMGDLSSPWGPSTEEIYVIGDGFIGKRSGQILRDPKRPHGDHPNEKPIGLMEMLVRACPPMWRLIDPFMGSGSTLVAAKNLGRKAIGIELEERYCEIAARRLAQQTLFGASP